MTKSATLNGNTYEVKRTSCVDRVYKGTNIYANLYKVYKNSKLIKEFTSRQHGDYATESGFDFTNDKLVVIYTNKNMNGEEVKCLLNEKAIKRQWFYNQEGEIIIL